MKKSFAIFFIFSSVLFSNQRSAAASTCSAENATQAELPSPLASELLISDDEIISQLMAASGAMKEFTADFTQVRKVALLNDEVVQKGQIQYRNDGRIMWKYTSPKQQQIAFSKDDIRISNGTETQIMSLDENPLLSQLKDLLMGLMSGQQLSANGRFAVNVIQNDSKFITLSMVPTIRQLKKFISEVRITFTAPDKLVSQVVMMEGDGSSTTITFTNRKAK